MIGSMLPTTEPNVTTPARLIQIVAAMRYGCPAESYQPKWYQSTIRSAPIKPRKSPRTSPVVASRPQMRHQSRNMISRNASERMMIVVDCEPLFPPLLIMSGTNSATMAAR